MVNLFTAVGARVADHPIPTAGKLGARHGRQNAGVLHNLFCSSEMSFSLFCNGLMRGGRSSARCG
jgi:hypothetical protein